MKVARSVLAVALLAVVLPLRADAAPVQVDIDLYTYDPLYLEVEQGQRIRWTNREQLGVPHNVILTQTITPEGELLVDSVDLCRAMDPGQSCAPTSAEIAEGLPPGTHFLTCTIDREHTLLMHQVIVVR